MLRTFATIFYFHLAVSIVCILECLIVCFVRVKTGTRKKINREEVKEKAQFLEESVEEMFNLRLTSNEIVFLAFFVPVLNIYMTKYIVTSGGAQ